MNKLRTWWHVLVKSFTSVKYYEEVLKVKFWFSLKFFLVYFLLFSVVVTGVITARYLLPLNDFFTLVLPSELAQIYPDELMITIKDGVASTNVDEPYFISIDRLDNLKKEFDERVLGTNTMKLNNLLVIDTEAKLEDFPQYQTVALLTDHHLSVINNEGNIESIRLSEVDNVVIDKQMVDDWMDRITPLLGYVVPVLVLALWLGILLGSIIVRLAFSLILGMLLWWMARLMRKSLTFNKAWQLNLHFVVISTTGFGLANWIGGGLKAPYLETILVLGLGIMVVSKLSSDSKI